MIKHGIGQSGFGDSADFYRDAEGDLMDGLECLVIKEGFLGTDEF
ncbi:MAG: hypothetical protein WA974_08080 [Thermodesulfobacteriota bacterium]